MKRMRLLAATLLFALASCSPPEELIDGEGIVVLEGATVVDETGATPRFEAVVVLQNERILKVGNAGDEVYPDGSTVMDLRGRYVLPGFIDTHVHPPRDAETRPATVRTLLAFGITTIRNPAARPGAGVQLRNGVSAGELLGPRVLTAGPLIDAPTIRPTKFPEDWTYLKTEEEIRAEVRRQQESGVDFIKLYRGLAPGLVVAAIDESHKAGLLVIGHLGKTSWLEAARAGIDVLVHSGPSVGLIQPLRRDQNPELTPGEYERLWRETVDLEGPEMEVLVSALINNGVEVNPTLVLTEAIRWGDDLGTLERLEPELAPERDIPGWWGDDWRERHPYAAGWSAEDFSEAKATFTSILSFFRVLHERGVLVTAGTDVGNSWMTPGVSFHRELELLVQAGIPPLEVLMIATRNGADALGILDDVGTIEAGKRADLIVLTEDPVLDIVNTRSIEAVYLGGRRLEPTSLLNR